MAGYLNIPISICIYSNKIKCYNQFQLYCWLKTQCSGHFRLTNKLKYKACRELLINTQTLKSRLQWLLMRKWIGYNSKSENYHINSFKTIHRRIGNNNMRSVVWDDYDFRLFRAFNDASIIIYFAKRKYWIERNQKKGRWKDIKVGIKFGYTRKSFEPPSFPLPVAYLSKILNKSQSSIVRMKKNAHNACFIVVDNQFECLAITKDQLLNYKKFNPNGHKAVIRKDKVYEQLPDMITPHITLKKKCNLKQTKLK